MDLFDFRVPAPHDKSVEPERPNKKLAIANFSLDRPEEGPENYLESGMAVFYRTPVTGGPGCRKRPIGLRNAAGFIGRPARAT